MESGKQIKGSGIFHGIILILNGLAIILLLAAYLAYHLNPSVFPYLSFAGLAYPYILALNILFVLFWALVRMKYAIVTLLIIAMGWNHVGRLIQFNGEDDNFNPERSFNVLSYNMQNFLKLNTSTTKYVTDFTNEDKIREFLVSQEVDIACLQEVLNDRKPNEEFIKEMSDLLGCDEVYYENYFSSSSGKLDALAIFTRFPIIQTGHLTYESKSIGIFTDVVREMDTMRVYNLHLASIHFKMEDYQFWSDIRNNSDQDSLKTGTFRIFKKIDAASVKRSRQVRIITSHFESSPYPIILCGDFNDSPSSYAYRKILGNKKDAFVESGSGFGSTYAGENFPSFRIDFIMHDNHFKSASFQRIKISYSDHYPIRTYLYPE